jgi:predicted PurR-regulated permease PerM
VIGLLFHPLNRRLLERMRGRRTLAALATLTFCLVIAIIPTLLVVGAFFNQGIAIYEQLQSAELNPASYVERVEQAFPRVQEFFGGFGLTLDSIKSALTDAAVFVSSFIAQHAVGIGQGTLTFFLNLGLMLYVAFFMFRDGERIVQLLVRALPLGDQRERLLFSKFAEVTRATIKGNLAVAVVQGSLGGLIFWILGIPAAIVWGVVMTVLSLIPLLGAGLVWVPVAIYLFAVGEWVDGLILAAFGALVIGLVDNVLRPLLVGRETKMPDYLVLLSTLGGLALFGINGFVIGPLVTALFLAFWDIFIREFNPD